MALSNFSTSFLCLMGLLSWGHTYFILSVSLSFQRAIHMDSESQSTAFQSPGGLGESGLRFSSMSLWRGPSFHLPRKGCCPRPMKMLLGSAM